MKAPDKIYVQPNAHDGWFEGNKPNDNFVEYIRKDALIEWAKEKLENLKGLLDAAPYKEVYVGKCEVYKELMDKLNSM